LPDRIRKRKIYPNRLINSKFSHLLSNAREERHEVLYGLEKTETKEDAEHTIKTAKEYLKETAKIIKQA